MYEHRLEPLLPRRQFYQRLARSFALALLVLIASLGVGMAGYHFLERMSWLDSFENAAMILSGMGPVGQVQTTAGKVFAGCYALFSGLAFISSVGVVVAPLFHRFIHRFHLEAQTKRKR